MTEMITGIDMVRYQIQVAEGRSLFAGRWRCRRREICLHRVRPAVPGHEQDSEKRLVPDYRKIHTYRSPAGFGIRLDGASAYSSTVVAY